MGDGEDDDGAFGGCLVFACLLGFIAICALAIVLAALPTLLDSAAKLLRIAAEIFLFPQPL